MIPIYSDRCVFNYVVAVELMKSISEFKRQAGEIDRSETVWAQ
jgi:hypothetical protein